MGAGFTADAAADLDGDAVLQFWGYARPNGAAGRVAGLPGRCDVAGLAADNQISACDATGASVFGQSTF